MLSEKKKKALLSFSAFPASADGPHTLLRTQLHVGPSQQWDGGHDPRRPDAGHGNQRGVPHLSHLHECRHRRWSGELLMLSSPFLFSKAAPEIITRVITYYMFVYKGV